MTATPTGAGKVFQLNSGLLVEGAVSYTFKFMLDFEPSEVHGTNVDNVGDNWYRLRVGNAIKFDSPHTGVWYEITLTPTEMNTCVTSQWNLWAAKYHQGSVDFYMTDVVANMS
jgi:hypothetical protein